MTADKSLRILLFAGVREIAGIDGIELDVSLPTSASDMLARLAEQIPDASELVRVSRLAVDGRYVGGDYVIDDSAGELALIPPVSGG